MKKPLLDLIAIVPPCSVHVCQRDKKPYITQVKWTLEHIVKAIFGPTAQIEKTFGPEIPHNTGTVVDPKNNSVAFYKIMGILN